MHKRATEHTCVVGLAWGDEGKGKVMDLLCPKFDVAVRFNGGANAGHTVCIDGQRYALHLLPTGVLHPNVTNVIGPGVVLDPLQLLTEIDALAERGIDAAGRVLISERAHLVMPYHKLEDQLRESSAAGVEKIGTTSRGIGPCYADKMTRATALRAIDLLDADRFLARMKRVSEQKSSVLSGAVGHDAGVEQDQLQVDIRKAAVRLAPMVCDTTTWLQKRVAAGDRVLFEGANGMLLDVDHGTYPYVTSSNTGPSGVATGAGVPPDLVTCRLGVTKAYATRVGRGPFPTELTDAIGDDIREKGKEYGTTTGRPRRCGWLDAVALRNSVYLGAITDIALMHLDTLGGFESVGICVEYRHHGRTLDKLPASSTVLDEVEPVLEMMPGWPEHGLADVSSFDELPKAAADFVLRLEKLLGAPISLVSVGADRHRTIVRNRKWENLTLSADPA